MKSQDTLFAHRSKESIVYPKKHEQFLVSLQKKNLSSNLIWKIFMSHFKNFSEDEQLILLNHPNFPEDKLIKEWEALDHATITKISAVTKSSKIIDVIAKEDNFAYFLAPNQHINDEISCKIIEDSKNNNFGDLDLSILDNPVFPEQFKHYLMKQESLKVLPVYFYEKHFAGFKYPLSMLKLFRNDLLFGAGSVWVPQRNVNLFNIVKFCALAREYGKVQKEHIALGKIEERLYAFFQNGQQTISTQRYSTSLVDDTSLIMRILNDPDMDLKNISKFSHDFMKVCMLFRHDVPENVLESLANSKNHFIRFLVAINPSSTDRVLNQLIYLGPDYVRFEVLNNGNFKNTSVFDKIIDSDNVEDRRNIAGNKNLSFEHMTTLANDEDIVVRTFLSLNSSVPKILKNLM